MRRVAVALAGLAAIAAATVVVIRAAAGGDRVDIRSRPLAASVSLSPDRVLFGDPVVASVAIAAGSGVDPASIRVDPDFRPFQVSSAEQTREESGGLTVVDERIVLSCLSADCLPTTAGDGEPAKTVAFPDLEIHYRLGGRPQVLSLPLPSVTIGSRLSSSDRAKPAGRLRVPSGVPPPTYAVSPGTLSTAMIAAAGVLLALALVLVALALRGTLARAPGQDRRPPLARALAAVREAAVRGDVRRLRPALGWLARELRSSGREDVAADALRLAWSGEPPNEAAVSALADAAEESDDAA